MSTAKTTTNKFQKHYIIMRTSHVNHTALFKAAEKTETFKRAFYTTPSKYSGKELTSREHDEVICQSLLALSLGIKVAFKEGKNGWRYAIFHSEFRSTDADSSNAIRIMLADFSKQYKRIHDITYHVLTANMLSDIVVD